MKNKTTAALLAIFLGGLGLHRFYVGNVILGLFYLLFCWTFIPSILGLIDGVFYLLRSEQSFNSEYNKKFLPRI